MPGANVTNVEEPSLDVNEYEPFPNGAMFTSCVPVGELTV
jgi:hypothetical protein